METIEDTQNIDTATKTTISVEPVNSNLPLNEIVTTGAEFTFAAIVTLILVRTFCHAFVNNQVSDNHLLEIAFKDLHETNQKLLDKLSDKN